MIGTLEGVETSINEYTGGRYTIMRVDPPEYDTHVQLMIASMLGLELLFIIFGSFIIH